MLPPLKHIIRLSVFLLLMGNFVSCQSWHEAKEVIAEADSLLAKGLVIEDTALLATTIHTLDNQIGRVLAREKLAKIYYHLARNFYHANDFSTAAEYYIVADRLCITSFAYKGRLNSCMGYLCKQDSCFVEALEFYERANEAFKKIPDKNVMRMA